MLTDWKKNVVPVHGCRNISKKAMVWNDRTPKLTVDPETYKVTVDGEEITSRPAEKLPLTQLTACSKRLCII